MGNQSMYGAVQDQLTKQLEGLKAEGLYKSEQALSSAQAAQIRVGTSKPLLNLCANNYLGLANHPEIVRAAHEALDRWGYGLSSVRFICGTQTIHQELETQLSQFLGTDDTILYSSCFDANGGLFETLLTDEDAVISDELNHASIIDGIRLCKARRFRYRNNDMDSLESALKDASTARRRRLPPMACSPWTERSLLCDRSAIWPTSLMRWSWWTIHMPSASWEPAEKERTSFTT